MEFRKTISTHRIVKQSDETKRRAVRMILSGDHLKKTVCEQFGVGYNTLDRWIDKFGPELVQDDLKISSVHLTQSSVMENSPEQLKARIKELEKQLENANLKSELLTIMIDIAEEELKIPIRKKYGPQPSGAKHKKGGKK